MRPGVPHSGEWMVRQEIESPHVDRPFAHWRRYLDTGYRDYVDRQRATDGGKFSLAGAWYDTDLQLKLERWQAISLIDPTYLPLTSAETEWLSGVVTTLALETQPNVGYLARLAFLSPALVGQIEHRLAKERREITEWINRKRGRRHVDWLTDVVRNNLDATLTDTALLGLEDAFVAAEWDQWAQAVDWLAATKDHVYSTTRLWAAGTILGAARVQPSETTIDRVQRYLEETVIDFAGPFTMNHDEHLTILAHVAVIDAGGIEPNPVTGRWQLKQPSPVTQVSVPERRKVTA